jgi:hypothetical protein
MFDLFLGSLELLQDKSGHGSLTEDQIKLLPPAIAIRRGAIEMLQQLAISAEQITKSSLSLSSLRDVSPQLPLKVNQYQRHILVAKRRHDVATKHQDSMWRQ